MRISWIALNSHRHNLYWIALNCDWVSSWLIYNDWSWLQVSWTTIINNYKLRQVVFHNMNRSLESRSFNNVVTFIIISMVYNNRADAPSFVVKDMVYFMSHMNSSFSGDENSAHNSFQPRVSS